MTKAPLPAVLGPVLFSFACVIGCRPFASQNPPSDPLEVTDTPVHVEHIESEPANLASDPSLHEAQNSAKKFAPPKGTHPFSILDMVAMNRVSDLTLAPDQQQFVFSVSTKNLSKNGTNRALWSHDLRSGASQQISPESMSASNPQWAPDSQTLYFLSSQSGSSQVWKLNLQEKSAPIQITDLPLDIGNLRVSPDGRTLVFSLEVFPDGDSLKTTLTQTKQRDKPSSSAQIYDRMFVRHWDTWSDHQRSHLFSYQLENGQIRDLSPTLDADVPSKPFGGIDEFTFTPNSRQVVFTARDAQGGGSEPWSTNFDLFVVPVDASSPPRKITDNPAWDTHPRFSPDGKTLAYLAMERPGFESDRFRVVLKTWPDGPVRTITQEWDRSISDLSFTPNGSSLLATVLEKGHKKIYALDTTSNPVNKMLIRGDGTNSAPVVVGNYVYHLHDDFQRPKEIWKIQLVNNAAPVQVSSINNDTLARVKTSEAIPHVFRGFGGDQVHAWVIPPLDYDPRKKYPAAFLIHGGPQGSFSNHFHYRWNPQVYTSAGYAAIMIDFHGSTGYGQAFTDSITGDWGNKPLVDLQKGLKSILEKFDWINGDQICALGASYGGYMVNWIAGKWSDRFKCLVNHDGIFDQRSMYYTTEELWFVEWEQGGPHFDRPKNYERHNPANLVNNWKTPMLVVHGGLDYRVPLDQGIATFTALQRRGIESKFLFFPDENHWVLKPHNMIKWHQVVLGWLSKHLTH